MHAVNLSNELQLKKVAINVIKWKRTSETRQIN